MASTDAVSRAAAAFKKEERAREGVKNMSEYLAAKEAEARKTERLRTMRLAHEAAQQQKAEQAAIGRADQPAAARRQSKPRRTKAPARE